MARTTLSCLHRTMYQSAGIVLRVHTRSILHFILDIILVLGAFKALFSHLCCGVHVFLSVP